MIGCHRQLLQIFSLHQFWQILLHASALYLNQDCSDVTTCISVYKMQSVDSITCSQQQCKYKRTVKLETFLHLAEVIGISKLLSQTTLNSLFRTLITTCLGLDCAERHTFVFKVAYQ